MSLIKLKTNYKKEISTLIEESNYTLDNDFIKKLQIKLYSVYLSYQRDRKVKKIKNSGSRVLREKYKKRRNPKGMHISAIRDEFIEDYKDNDEVNW